MDNASVTGRLPDFVFERRRDIELECDFVLAGMLLTDVPKGGKLNKSDDELIRQIISQLGDIVKRKPNLTKAGIWRTGQQPPDGLTPPFDDHLLEERARRCICVMVA